MIFNSDTKQISFVDFDDETEEVDERQHYLDLVSDVKKMMAKIKNTPNENFPSFLWEPAQNNFTDEGNIDYHRYISMGLGKFHVENGSEILRAINKVKNSYKNYFKYIDALEVYRRYYDFVEETYGSFDMLINLSKDGLTNFPIRRKPKLKGGKKSRRHLLEIKVPVSRIDRSQGLSDAQIAQLASELPDQIDVYEDYYEYVNYLSAFNRKEELRLQKVNRVKGFRKTSSVTTNENTAIMDYLTGGDSSINQFGAIGSRPLSDDIEAFHAYDDYNDNPDLKKYYMGLRDYKIDPDLGILVDSLRDDDSMELYETLANNGYNVGIILDNSTMSKKAVKMIKDNIYSPDENISAKKAKKLKKKREKANKKLYGALSANESVRDILTKNRVHFDVNEQMFSFTSKDPDMVGLNMFGGD